MGEITAYRAAAATIRQAGTLRGKHRKDVAPGPLSKFHRERFDPRMENHAAEIELAERRNKELNEQRRSAPELREYRPVYWLRLILRILSVLTCVLIIFSLVDGIRDFQRTRHVRNPYQDGSGTFSVWPEREGLKLYPTYALLSAAVIAGGISLVLVAASFTKAVSNS